MLNQYYIYIYIYALERGLDCINKQLASVMYHRRRWFKGFIYLLKTRYLGHEWVFKDRWLLCRPWSEMRGFYCIIYQHSKYHENYIVHLNSAIWSSKVIMRKGEHDDVRIWKLFPREETFSALLALCAGNSPVTVEFPSQRPVSRSYDVFFHLRLE